MSIKKAGSNKKNDLKSFLVDLWKCKENLQRIIENHNYPRPDGVRVCVTYGDAHFEKNPDDWYSDIINVNSKILLIPGKHPFIVHQSARELLPRDMNPNCPYKFSKIQKPSFLPPLLDPGDANGLFRFDYYKK